MDKIISLRFHHIDRFLRYFYGQQKNVVINPDVPKRYGEEFARKSKDLFEFIASGGTNEDYVLVVSGLDSLCKMCPIKKKDCSEQDVFYPWEYLDCEMESMDLTEGDLCSMKEFLGKVKSLYPNEGHS